MGRHRRGVLKCNIPMLLNVIVATYLYLTSVFFEGNMWIAGTFSFLTIWSLYQASLHHPGPVHLWMVDGEEQCKHCGQGKPPRAHHCRRCAECIDRYDHHCDWIDNCVGRRNYKAFVLFLVYINACILHYYYQLGVFFNSVTCVSCRHRLHLDRVSILHATMVFVYTFVVIPCWILALVFLFKTLYNALRNVTTYEEHVMKAAENYDCGWRSNLVDALGRDVKLWCLPTMVDDRGATMYRSSPVCVI